MNYLNEVFGRVDDNGNVAILTRTDGVPVRRLDLGFIYPVDPVDSGLSCMYEHPRGIRLTRDDCEALGIEVEDA